MTASLSTLQKPLAANAASGQVSWLNGIDPRVRILCACGFAVAVVACQNFAVLTLAVLIAFGLLLVSRLPARRTLRRMAAMDGFVLMILVMLPFTVPGEPMFTVLGMPASRDGFLQAIEIGLTANAVILALMALVGSMEPVTMGHALHQLRVPASLVNLLMFTVRYIDVLRDEYLRLRQAMRARGFRPSTNWHSYRSFGYLVGMMLVRSMERSERILGAMKCRGFTGRIPLLYRMTLSSKDVVFACLFSVMVIGLLVAELSRAAL